VKKVGKRKVAPKKATSKKKGGRNQMSSKKTRSGSVSSDEESSPEAKKKRQGEEGGNSQEIDWGDEQFPPLSPPPQTPVMCASERCMTRAAAKRTGVERK
jgi:hypothetical protein